MIPQVLDGALIKLKKKIIYYYFILIIITYYFINVLINIELLITILNN